MKVVATYTRNDTYKDTEYYVLTTGYADEIYMKPEYIQLKLEKDHSYIVDVTPRCKDNKAFFGYKIISEA